MPVVQQDVVEAVVVNIDALGADSGRGIDPDQLARVLEPLFSTKPSGTGRGMGLSVASGFAFQSGGTLTVASTPGRGTEIVLYVPVIGGDADGTSND